LVHSLCQHESIDGEFDGDDEDNSTQPMIVTTEYVFPGPDLGIFDVGYALYQAYEDFDAKEMYQSIGTYAHGDGANLTSSSGTFNTKCMGGRLLFMNEPSLKPLAIGQTF